MERDIVIIGGGPAGLSAGLYGVRRSVGCMVITPQIGGRILKAHKIENYLGTKTMSGTEFMKECEKQAKAIGLEMLTDEVMDCDSEGEGPKRRFVISTASGKKITAKAIIFATGIFDQKLGVPGEEEFLGKGVSYCAECDAYFFNGKRVIVVGGGNAAAHAALILKNIAKEVEVINEHPGDMDQHLSKQLKAEGVNIRVGKIKEIKGDKFVKSVAVNGWDEPVDGIFVELGTTPTVNLAAKLGVEMDGKFIKVDEKRATNVPGIFAAGDICGKTLQIVTAAADGAIALMSAHGYISSLK